VFVAWDHLWLTQLGWLRPSAGQQAAAAAAARQYTYKHMISASQTPHGSQHCAQHSTAHMALISNTRVSKVHCANTLLNAASRCCAHLLPLSSNTLSLAWHEILLLMWRQRCGWQCLTKHKHGGATPSSQGCRHIYNATLFATLTDHNKASYQGRV
jgi:hypothetical protein